MLLTPPPGTGLIRFKIEDPLDDLVIVFDFGWMAWCVFLPNRLLSLELYLVDPVEVGGRRDDGVGRRCDVCDRGWGRDLPRFAIISSKEESRSMNVEQV